MRLFLHRPRCARALHGCATTPIIARKAVSAAFTADVELSCRVCAGITVDAHPVEDGDTGEIVGSTLVAFTRFAGQAEIVVSRC